MKNFTLLFVFLIHGISYCQVNFDKKSIDEYSTSGAYDTFHIDLDSDGDVDILGTIGNAFLWYENDGTGIFYDHIVNNEPVYSAIARVVSAGDIDNDGDIDIIGGTRQKIIVFKNDGNQNFAPTILKEGDGSTSINVNSIEIEDINQDNHLDLLVSLFFEDKFVLYLNDTTGNFTETLISDDINYTNGASHANVVDLDNDGDLDVVGAPYYALKFVWFENDGNLNFTPRIVNDFMDISEGASYIQSADFDFDGDIDLVGANVFYSLIIWFENDGNQNFIANPIYEAADVGKVLVADMDGDNDLDVLTNYNHPSLDGFYWFENNRYNFSDTFFFSGSISSSFHVINDTSIHSSRANAVGAADINNDGFIDVYGSSRWKKFSWFKNSGNSLDYEAFYIDRSIAARTSNSIDGGDFDGDGDIDFAGTAGDGSIVSWFENLGNDVFFTHIIDDRVPYTQGVDNMEVVDLDQDGDLDLVVAAELARIQPNTVFGAYVWYENDGTGTFNFHLINYSTNYSRNVRCLTIADFDSDSDLDIAGVSDNDDKYVLFRNDGSQNFIPEYLTPQDIFLGSPSHIEKVDIDNDGDMDLLTTSYSDNIFMLLENDGLGVFTYSILDLPTTTGQRPIMLKGGDLDGDGDQDILASRIFPQDLGWFENDGNQNFSYNEISIDFYPQLIEISDLDGDSDLDFLLISGDTFQFINDGDANFTPFPFGTDMGLSNEINFIKDIDINGDDLPDLVCSTGNDFYHFINEGIINLSVMEHPFDDQNQSVLMFPNPLYSGKQLNIEILNDSHAQLVKIEVYDLEGKRLFETIESKLITSKFDMDFLEKGIYLVNMHFSNGAKVVKKLIKM